ncbi:MAG: D-alanyl-D-alanine carboxypeptidase, partial [Acidimicrobiales bacterium]
MSVRTLLPVGLVLVAVGSLVTAVRVDAERSSTTRTPAAAVTPVLSARRVPELLAAPVADRRLTAALDDLLARTPGSLCLTVAAGGRPVYTRNPSEPLVPASLAKLMTAVVALELLGPDTTFRTAVTAAAAPADGVVGDVYLIGGGDPLLETDPYELHFKHQPQTRTDFESLADAIVAAGVTEVR